MGQYGGNFPDTEENLRSLPGIGSYTAAAITAIAYNQWAVVVDGNVERVLARLYTVEKPIAETRPLLRQLATRLTPQDRPGDYAQAIMDLGALICTPRSPKCIECPWTRLCKAHSTGIPECWPRKKTKAKKPRRYGVAFWIERSDGAVILRRRPDKGILGGMTEIPTSVWYDHPLSERSVRAQSPIKTHWETIPGLVRHSFTHFNLELTILTAEAERTPKDAFWCPKRKIKSEALPSLMRKVVALVQTAQNSS
jgi:A/G-specific adenine glycosylase